MFRMNLNDTGGNRITPDTDPVEYDASNGTICQALHWSANNIYECENKGQLIRYYHASLCSHPKQTLVVAAKAKYLKCFHGLDADVINSHIGIETFTEMGHMRQLPSGTHSTTSASKCGQPAQALHLLERDAASDDVLQLPM